MNYQEDFNRAYLGLKAQGFEQAVSYSETQVEGCVLLAADGKRCAIGHLVSDATPGDAVSDQSQALLADPFYAALREAHDWATGPEAMKQKLVEVAGGYGLRVPGEDEQ